MANQPDIRYINSYVSGSVAYKIAEPQPKRKRVRLPKPKKVQTELVIKVDPVAVIGAVVAMVLVVCLVVGVVQLGIARHNAQTLENYIVTLQEKNEQLRLTYTESYDLAEIRQIATAMGMVPRDQVPVLLIDVNIPQPEPPVSGWDAFWSFVAEMFA